MDWENIVLISCVYWVPAVIYLIGMVLKTEPELHITEETSLPAAA